MAGGFKIKRGRPAYATTNLTVNGNYTTVVDLSAVTTVVPTGNLVTVAVSGSVPCNVWKYPQVTDGNSFAYYVEEISEYLTTQTVGLADGVTGTWTVTWKSGAGETGSTTTRLYRFTVSNAYPTSWTMQNGTSTTQQPARYGGPLLTKWGAAASITDIKDSGGVSIAPASWPFEVFGGRLVWKASGSPAVNSYGTGRVVAFASAPVGNAVYTVIFDTGFSLSINVENFNYSVAPTPLTGTNAMTESAANYQPYKLADNPLNFGAVIYYEDGDFNGGAQSYRCGTGSAATRTARSGGPSAPADTMTATVIEDLTQAGWIRHKARTPWKARIIPGSSGGPELNPNADTATTGTAQYFLYEGLDTLTGASNGQTPLRFTCVQGTTGQRQLQWLAFRYCYASNMSIVANLGAGSHHCFAHLNWFVFPSTPSSTVYGALNVLSCDSEFIGNQIENANGDCIQHANFDSVYGSGKAKIWFNTLINKGPPSSSSDHPDFCQGVWGPAQPPLMVASPSGTFSGPSFVGNITFRGNTPSPVWSPGSEGNDGQALFSSDTYLTTKMNAKYAFNLANHSFVNSITPRGAATGTVIRSNTNLTAYQMTTPPGAPLYRFGGDSGIVVVEDNAVAGSALYTLDSDFSGSVGLRPATHSNINNFPTLVSAQAIVTCTAANLTNLSSTQSALAAYQPVAASAMFPVGKANIGGIDPLRVNHRRMTFDTTVLNEDTITPPVCTVQATIPASPPTGVLITPTAETWIDDTSGSTYAWIRLNANGSFTTLSTAATYTPVAGDVGRTIWRLSTRTGPNGVGQYRSTTGVVV